MKKFILIIGDGFTKDFIYSTGIRNINTSKPLQNFNNPDISYDWFIDKLPSIKDELIKFSQEYDDEFKAIGDYIKYHQSDARKQFELRLFLSLSYSLLQQKINEFDLTQWKWFKWINEHKDQFHCAVSFNYDVLLESILSQSNIKYSRTGSSEVEPGFPFYNSWQGIPIIKPHGSIDFDIPARAIRMPEESRWSGVRELNDAEIMNVIPESKWLTPRVEADLIPPSQENIQLNLRWVQAGFDRFERMQYRGDIESLIIMGHSYGKPDQPEMNFFIDNISKDTLVYIVNPMPSPELIDKIESSGLKLNIITDTNSLPW